MKISLHGKVSKDESFLNVTKPLKRGNRISMTSGKKAFRVFGYERLPDFCYVCGRSDHQEQD